jgi:cytochrome c556
MKTKLAPSVLAGTALAFSGAAAPRAQGPVQSIQEIMDTVVDPSADSLWEVAGTVVEHGKTQVRQPRTDKDWKAARTLALSLIDGAKRLQTPRPVGSNGHWALADALTPGIRSAVQIQADIAADPARFYKAAARLQKTSQDALAALDARNIPAFLDAGARIDAACEACHAAYWYPRRAPGHLAGPDIFAKTALRP